MTEAGEPPEKESLTEELHEYFLKLRSDNIRLSWVIHHFESLPVLSRLKFLIMPKRTLYRLKETWK